LLPCGGRGRAKGLMGLSPTLLDYAENIWRRFPEAFISLGLPQLEDLFVLNEGNWSYRVVDTKWSKIVEIVLPRRFEDQPELDDASYAEAEEVEEDEDPPVEAAPPQPSSTPPASATAQGSADADPSKAADISMRLVQLDSEVNKLLGSITDRVSQEVEVQLQRELWGRNMQERLQSVHNSATRGQSPTALSQPESSGSAASSLAARRGVSLSPFDTGSLRRWPPGGGDNSAVTRVPHLDRTDSRASSRELALSASPSPPSEANSGHGAGSLSRTREDHGSDSPGTQIQRRAERRRRLGALSAENEGLDAMSATSASMPSGAIRASMSLPVPSRSALTDRGDLPAGSLPTTFDSEYADRDYSSSLGYMHNGWESGYRQQSDSRGATAGQNNSVVFQIAGGDEIYDDRGSEQEELEECHSPVKGRRGGAMLPGPSRLGGGFS